MKANKDELATLLRPQDGLVTRTLITIGLTLARLLSGTGTFPFNLFYRNKFAARVRFNP